MARAVAEQPFSNDLGSPKWTYYQWLSRLSPFDERLESYARLLASGSVALIPTFGLLYLDLPWARNPWDEKVADLLDPRDINRPADRSTGRHERRRRDGLVRLSQPEDQFIHALSQLRCEVRSAR